MKVWLTLNQALGPTAPLNGEGDHVLPIAAGQSAFMRKKAPKHCTAPCAAWCGPMLAIHPNVMLPWSRLRSKRCAGNGQCGDHRHVRQSQAASIPGKELQSRLITSFGFDRCRRARRQARMVLVALQVSLNGNNAEQPWSGCNSNVART